MRERPSLLGGLLALLLTACVGQELPVSPPTIENHSATTTLSVTQEPPRPTFPALADPPQFTSTVLSVTDGDTITVLMNGTKARLRLVGIDCPERDQPFGPEATQLTTLLALDRVVTVTHLGQDRYHRVLADVVLPDTRVLTHELVRMGACWWYQHYAPRNGTLKQLEADARDAKRGLWADLNPTPPWEWRKQKK